MLNYVTKNSCPGTGHGTGRGNTKRVLELINSLVFMSKARRFQITLNEPNKYEQVKKLLGDFRYLISCKEKAPETGHEHIHIYVCYSSSKRLSKLMGAHIELCRGSNKQNIDYIRKNEDIIEEIGTPPVEGNPEGNVNPATGKVVPTLWRPGAARIGNVKKSRRKAEDDD